MQYASTAMQVVVQEHAPAEMRAQLEQQRQEIERLRMQGEDWRQSHISPYGFGLPEQRRLTWRESGEYRMNNVITCVTGSLGQP